MRFVKKIWITFYTVLIASNSFAQQNMQSVFEDCKVSGSTTIYDYGEKKWIYTDSLDAVRTTLPASTFKIFNSLIALENKIISDEHEMIIWDGTNHKLFGKSYPLWNQDTDLTMAFKNSTIWFYVNLAEKVGRKNYLYTLKKMHYGNGDFSEKGIDFWNYGNFGVSPKNQIEALIKLYENKLPFAEKHMETIKRIMVSEKQNNWVFHDKTGWARKDGENIGWWIGYITTSDNVYFFATRITDSVTVANTNFSDCRKTITKRILHDYILHKDGK